jgi:hypothetical protein
MAKLGEGDARWIVAERQDGTNVGAWHWCAMRLCWFAAEWRSRKHTRSHGTIA